MKLVRNVVMIFLAVVVGYVHADMFVPQQVDNELPIVVIVPSYNNKRWYEKNLTSIFSQEYTNYRVIYVDDGSPDGTGQLVHNFIEQHGLWDRFTLIKNKERAGCAIANIYKATHMCQPHEITVTLDGDDWFAHPYVFQRLHKEYTEQDAWLTYGQLTFFPRGPKDYCRQISAELIDRNEVRRSCGSASHLRTYYAWLFHQIKLEDLLYDGLFFQATGDKACMAPLLEMSGHHARFIPEILYIYNVANPIGDARVRGHLQVQMRDIIFQMKPYQPLKQPVVRSYKAEDVAVQVVVLSTDAPDQAQATIQSIIEHTRGVRSITVLYAASTPEHRRGYDTLATTFLDVECCAVDSASCKDILLSTLRMDECPYVVCVSDKAPLTHMCNMAECTARLHQTYAHGFYLHCTEQVLQKKVELTEQIGAYQFRYGTDVCAHQHQLYGAVYNKRTACDLLQKMNFNSFMQLEHALAEQKQDGSKVGLFFKGRA